MKDNVIMFFIVFIILVVVFIVIGMIVVFGNKDLVRMMNLYILLYMVFENNKIVDKYFFIIKNYLVDVNILYWMVLFLYIYIESNVYVMKLSEYNEFVRVLGY